MMVFLELPAYPLFYALPQSHNGVLVRRRIRHKQHFAASAFCRSFRTYTEDATQKWLTMMTIGLTRCCRMTNYELLR